MPNFDEIALIEMEETYPSRLARLTELQQKYPEPQAPHSVWGTTSSPHHRRELSFRQELEDSELSSNKQKDGIVISMEKSELLILERWFAPEYQRMQLIWMQLWPDLHRQERANWERRLAEHRSEGKEMEEFWEMWDALPHTGGATA